MAWITQNNVATYPDVGLQLGAEELVLPMPFGSDWTQMRIAIHYSILIQSAINQAAATLRFGVCCGNLGYSVSNTTGWLGSQISLTSYNAGSPGYWSTANCYGVWKVNTSTAQDISAVNTFCLPRWPVRGIHLFDIAKSPSELAATGHALALRYTAAASGNTDTTSATFIEAARNYTTPGAYFILAGSVGPVTDYPGPTTFDTLSVVWNRCFPVLEVYELAVYRIT